MERLTLACGGAALNSFDGLTRRGHAGPVYEYPWGEEKFTFPEKCDQISTHPLKEAVRDVWRAVENAIEGAGAVQVAMAEKPWSNVSPV